MSQVLKSGIVVCLLTLMAADRVAAAPVVIEPESGSEFDISAPGSTVETFANDESDLESRRALVLDLSSHNETVIAIAMNDASVADLNAAMAPFTIGSASSIDDPEQPLDFGVSVTDYVTNQTRQLVLDIADIPEPSLLLLGAIAAAGFARHRARQLTR